MISHFGLDIGSDSIKIAQVSKEKSLFKLVSAGIAKTPGSGLVSEAEKDQVSLAETVKKLKQEAKIASSEVVTSISEKNVFSQVIEVPKMAVDELASAIPWEAENLIPYPIADVNLDWEIIETKEGFSSDKIKVFLVAAPTKLIDKYLRVLKLADLEPLALETETLATVRCLKPVFNEGSLLLVDLGMKSSGISIIDRGVLYLTRSVPTAGEALSRAIAASLNLELSVAEEYKKNYGLSGEFEGKIVKIVEPILATLVSEMTKAIRFYQEKSGNPIKLAMLCGGTSLLPGISEFLAKALGLEVQIVDPLSLLSLDEKTQINLRRNSPLFAVTIGLAMREG